MIDWKASGALVAAVAALALSAAPASADPTYSNGILTVTDNQFCNSGDVSGGLANPNVQIDSPDAGFACGNLGDDPVYENGILRVDENQICNSGDVAGGVLVGVLAVGSEHGPFLCENGGLVDGLSELPPL